MADKRYWFPDDYEICRYCRGTGWDPAFDYTALKRSCRPCGGSGSVRRLRPASVAAPDVSIGSVPLTRDAALAAALLCRQSLLRTLESRVASWQRSASQPLPVLQLPSLFARWQPGPAENAQWAQTALRWRDIYAHLAATIADLDPESPCALATICSLRGLGEDHDHELAVKLGSLESSCRTLRAFRPGVD